MKKIFPVAIMIIAINACSEHTNTNNDITPITDSTGYDSSTVDHTKTRKDSALSFTGDQLIIPGESVGKIKLGINDSMLTIELGKPDMSDAAMGKAWLTWYGKTVDEHNNKTELNIYTSYKDTNMREKTVQQIRTTSSFFETENGLHVYSSLGEIKNKFQHIKRTATYNDSSREVIIYDDQQQGIAFEIVSAGQQKMCTGIIIHQPGIKVTQTYISLHPDMHLL